MNNIAFTTSAKKDIRKLASTDRTQVFTKLRQLTHPFPDHLNIKYLANSEGYYRLRVDMVRVIFFIHPTSKDIVIRHVGYRGKIYRKLWGFIDMPFSNISYVDPVNTVWQILNCLP